MGLELDAISSSVIGGTLLTGGVGNVIGTTVGVLIQGVIQTIVTYQNLNTWWTKVTIAALLCIFIVIQRVIAIARKSKGDRKLKPLLPFKESISDTKQGPEGTHRIAIPGGAAGPLCQGHCAFCHVL